MKNSRLLTLFAAAWLVAMPATAARSQADPAAKRLPNIVFIFADDLGLEGLSCYGGDKYKTPNLDALAAGGTRFDLCYSTPLCGPSRCQLLTGRYPFRTGGTTNQTAGRPSPDKEVSIAKVLKQAGYATAHAGKWRQVGASPGGWGFDEFITDPTASGYYWTKKYTQNGKAVERDAEVYYHDVLQDFAADFMTRHREKLFFFYYAMHLVHGPILKTPDSAPDSKDLYGDNIAYMDKLVGKVIAELDRLDLRKETLVLFSIDNGTPGKRGTIGGRAIHGGKGSLFEGGSRVPLIASWKGTTPEGKVNKDLIDFSDFFPTFAELAGAKSPEGVAIDGRSFAPVLKGLPGKPREWLFVQLGDGWYARDPRFKLNEKGELFDLKDAPFQEIPVAADAPDADAQAARKTLAAVLEGFASAGLKATGPPKKKKGQNP